MERLRELTGELTARGIPYQEGEALRRHTSFQIGGPAAVMAFPRDEGQWLGLCAVCGALGVRPVILGAGTNVLAPDQGVDTLVIETKTNFGGVEDLGGGVLEAGSGATLSRLASFAAERGLTGLEFAHGIPGTVGGGLYMNAGAYGGEMGQVVLSARVLYPDGTIQTLSRDDLALSYRHSALMERPCAVLRVRVGLRPGQTQEIRAEMARLMERRRASQPLEYPSAGSTFRRPQGGYAAALIEQAGLKGLTIGGAQVSEKHAGFVINRGGATCADVRALMAEIQRRVEAQSGIRLEPEVRMLEG